MKIANEIVDYYMCTVFMPKLQSVVGCLQTLTTGAVDPGDEPFLVALPPLFFFEHWTQKQTLPFLNFLIWDLANSLACKVFLHWVHVIISIDHVSFCFVLQMARCPT